MQCLHQHKHSGRIAPDLLLAYAVAVICGVVTQLLYSELRRVEARHNVILPIIERGQHRTVLMSGGNCVGELLTKLSDDDAPLLETDLLIRSVFRGERDQTQVSIRAFFNPLLQLNRAKVTIASARFSVVITAQDVTPIKIAVSGTLGAVSRSFEMTIPGPLTLARTGTSTHRLEYAYIPAHLKGTTARGILDSLTADLGLALTPLSEDSTVCNPSVHEALDLAPLIAKFGPLLQPLIDGDRQ